VTVEPLKPRKLCWVIKDRLAAAERPGGYGRNHRKVRRQEEIIWLREHGFTRVVSLLDSPHNRHTHGEMGMPHSQVPLGRVGGDLAARLPEVYSILAELLDDPSQLVLVHLEDFGERLCGVLAGYLLYAGLVESGPVAISIIERLTGRQMGPPGREVVVVTLEEGLVKKSGRSPGER
jgi:hypothetical protein